MLNISLSSIAGLAVAIYLVVRQMRHRAMAVDGLWRIPAGAIFVAVAMTWNNAPTSAVEWAAVLAGAVVGGVLGAVRAHVAITRVDVPGRKIYAKGNIWSAALLVLVVVIKLLVRTEGSALLHSTTTVMLALLAASICAQRLRFYLAFRSAAAAAA